jgi:restriction system protein
MVMQCKRYTPKRRIWNREVLDLMGSQVHFAAIAISVANTTSADPPNAAPFRTAFSRSTETAWGCGTTERRSRHSSASTVSAKETEGTAPATGRHS